MGAASAPVVPAPPRWVAQLEAEQHNLGGPAASQGSLVLVTQFTNISVVVGHFQVRRSGVHAFPCIDQQLSGRVSPQCAMVRWGAPSHPCLGLAALPRACVPASACVAAV